MNAIRSLFDDKNDGSPQVLIGDLNTGPSLPMFDIDPEFADQQQLLVDDGWVGANNNSESPFCTWCPSSNPNAALADLENNLIDQILVRNAQTSDPRRIFDELVTVTTPEGSSDVYLSDHYGSQASVTYRPK